MLIRSDIYDALTYHEHDQAIVFLVNQAESGAAFLLVEDRAGVTRHRFQGVIAPPERINPDLLWGMEKLQFKYWMVSQAQKTQLEAQIDRDRSGFISAWQFNELTWAEAKLALPPKGVRSGSSACCALQ